MTTLYQNTVKQVIQGVPQMQHRGAFDQTKTLTTQDIHSMSNHQNKINSNNAQDNNDKFIKSYRSCGKGHQN